MIRNNFYIEILKYATLKNEFTYLDLFESLNLNSEEKFLFTSELMHNKLLLQNTGRNKKTEHGELSIFTISIEGRFKLLEYEELDEAKKSSKKATYIAIVAIIISAIFVICSIIAQIYYPVTLENNQFNKIIDAIKTQEEIKK